MGKVAHIIRGSEAYIDALILSTYNKSKHLFTEGTIAYNEKVSHPTESNVFGAIYDVYPDGENETWDTVKEDVLNPSHLSKLEVWTNEWRFPDD